MKLNYTPFEGGQNVVAQVGDIMSSYLAVVPQPPQSGLGLFDGTFLGDEPKPTKSETALIFVNEDNSPSEIWIFPDDVRVDLEPVVGAGRDACRAFAKDSEATKAM